jgi:hypothetical protein
VLSDQNFGNNTKQVEASLKKHETIAADIEARVSKVVNKGMVHRVSRTGVWLTHVRYSTVVMRSGVIFHDIQVRNNGEVSTFAQNVLNLFYKLFLQFRSCN